MVVKPVNPDIPIPITWKYNSKEDIQAMMQEFKVSSFTDDTRQWDISGAEQPEVCAYVAGV